jgi:NAD(P)-dependent dehydrogenase (short-subunit alcohol dehydrogenase family)
MNNMKHILITGGSRGIGLEFTRQYLQHGMQVSATSRFPQNAIELQSEKEVFGDQLTIYNLDVSDDISRRSLVDSIAKKDGKIDILINNAGIASGTGKFRYRFGELNQEDLCKTLLVNAVAPLMMTEAVFPFLVQGEDPVVVNITSNSGSIAIKNRNGGTGYGYSASKAALNMFTKMLSIELEESRIIVVSIHPGWVRTTMLYCENAPLEPVDSVRGMIQVIDSLEMKDSGRFIDWQGDELPW